MRAKMGRELVPGVIVALCLLMCLAAAAGSASPAGARDSGSAAGDASRQVVIERAKLTAVDRGMNDLFGYAVAIDGDTALVAALFGDADPANDTGAVYVYVRSGAGWAQQSKLVPDDPTGVGRFGCKVDLDGDTALIGAEYTSVGGRPNAGAAYVFVRSGTTWTQQAMLTVSGISVEPDFGHSVALDGDTALIGADKADTDIAIDSGAAWVFTRTGGAWTEQAKLMASDRTAYDYFGESVALDGDTAVVGARGDDLGALEEAGSAYVFVRSGTDWTEQAKLTAADGEADDTFGISVAVDGDTALAGAYLATPGSVSLAGAAYVFVRSGAAWTQQARLAAGDQMLEAEFGVSVAVEGDAALIGAEAASPASFSKAGAAYYFSRSGAAWTQRARLTASDKEVDACYGAAIALQGTTALVGAGSASVDAVACAGKAYITTVDWSRPVARAKDAIWVHGRPATLRVYVAKKPVGCGKAKVTVRLYRRGKLRKVLTTRYLAVNQWAKVRWSCQLPKGAYTMKLSARDLVGNKQTRATKAKLRVL